jgi:hypothetical protein
MLHFQNYTTVSHVTFVEVQDGVVLKKDNIGSESLVSSLTNSFFKSYISLLYRSGSNLEHTVLPVLAIEDFCINIWKPYHNIRQIIRDKFGR